MLLENEPSSSNQEDVLIGLVRVYLCADEKG